jgi:hypothetical protein
MGVEEEGGTWSDLHVCEQLVRGDVIHPAHPEGLLRSGNLGEEWGCRGGHGSVSGAQDLWT